MEQIPEIPESGIIIRKEGALVRVFFDIAKAPVPEIEGEESSHPEDLCECYTVDVAAPATYGSVIAAIVNDRYTTDDVQALQANFIGAANPAEDADTAKIDEYVNEWSDYQAWRVKAKAIAKEVVSMIGE